MTLGSLLVVGLLFVATGCSSTGSNSSDSGTAPTNQPSPADAAPANNQNNNTAARGNTAPPDAASRLVDEVKREADVRRRTARHYLEQGNRFFNDADYSRAERMYRQALDNDPTLEEARRRLQDSLMALGRRDGEIRSVLQELGAEIKVGQQQQLAEAKRLIQQGKDALADGDVDLALRQLGRARERFTWFDFGQDVTALSEEAQQLYDQARDQKIQSEADLRRSLEEESIAQAETETARQRSRTEQRKLRVMERAADAMMRRDYSQAVQLYEQVLELEPTHKVATRQYRRARDLQMAYRYVTYLERNSEESRKVWEELSESAIPWDNPFRFPEDEKYWRNEVQRRQQDLQTLDLGESFEVRQIKNTLESSRISFDFSAETNLGDAIAFLRDYTGLNITVDPEIDTVETPVKLRLSEVRLREALELLLANTGLAYTFQENTLYITEPGKAFGNRIFDIYNVTDILNKIRNFPGPSIRVKSNDEVDESGGSSPFGGFDDSDADEDSQLDPDTLVELIKESTGGEDAWDNSNSEIEPHKGNLLVNSTRELHLAVKDFLDNLRKGSDLFVIVEARFIDITDDFLEDIGVDTRNLGLPTGQGFGTPYGSLNSNRSGGFDQGFQNLGNPTNPSLIMGQDRVAGRIQHILDGFVGAASGSRLTSALRGLTLQATWLDPFQINAILRASQEERESRIITAPRVTASNGQRVYVSVITQRAYVQDYELVSGGTGLVVQEVADPVVGTFQDGVILDVQPVISADRKYITLDVRPTIASLINGIISTVQISLGSITQAAQLVEIDLPEISLQQAFTSVTVPDGGTVLLGGFRSLNERKYESYIPIVGKIPLLKNIFRRKAYLRERRSLYILITATVVDLREEERRLFN